MISTLYRTHTDTLLTSWVSSSLEKCGYLKNHVMWGDQNVTIFTLNLFFFTVFSIEKRNRKSKTGKKVIVRLVIYPSVSIQYPK